jgi:hypothetical protein
MEHRNPELSRPADFGIPTRGLPIDAAKNVTGLEPNLVKVHPELIRVRVVFMPPMVEVGNERYVTSSP